MATPKNKQNIGKHQNSVKNRFQKGHVFSDAVLEKIKVARSKQKNVSLRGLKAGQLGGEKNPSWRGGKKSWITRFVKTRDDYTCQVCGLRDPEIMEADHIKQRADFPELEFDADNIITICPNCHRRRTNKYLREKAERKRNGEL